MNSVVPSKSWTTKSIVVFSAVHQIAHKTLKDESYFKPLFEETKVKILACVDFADLVHLSATDKYWNQFIAYKQALLPKVQLAAIARIQCMIKIEGIFSYGQAIQSIHDLKQKCFLFKKQELDDYIEYKEAFNAYFERLDKKPPTSETAPSPVHKKRKTKEEKAQVLGTFCKNALSNLTLNQITNLIEFFKNRDIVLVWEQLEDAADEKKLKLTSSPMFEDSESFETLRDKAQKFSSWFEENKKSLCKLTALELGSFGLTSLPAELGQLTGLKTLDLYKNFLPSIPSWFCHLKGLTSLELFDNPLSEAFLSTLSKTCRKQIEKANQSRTALNEKSISLLRQYVKALPSKQGDC